MHRNNARHRVPRPQRGQALIVALGLVLALTVLISATQFLTVTHLGSTKVARYNERALLMAEQGINQILYNYANPTSAYPAANWAPAVVANPPTLASFAAGVINSTYTVTPYPAGSTTEGYYACVSSALTGTGGTIYVYGYSHRVARRVRVDVAPFGIFDWAAVYTINPSLSGGATNYLGTWDTSGNTNFSYQFSGSSANLVGVVGSEGKMDTGGTPTFYIGPLIMAGPNARFGTVSAPNTGTPPVGTAAGPGAPPGFNGGATPVVSPFLRFYSKSLGIVTADQAAVQWIQSSQLVANPNPAGVAYFQSANNNATGLRYLVWDGSTQASIRELGPKLNAQGKVTGNYTVPVTDNKGNIALADSGSSSSWSAPNNLASNSDLKAGEVIYAIRIYPGDYYFDYVSLSGKGLLYLRSYADTEYNALKSQLTYSFTYNANPNMRTVGGVNTQLSGEANIRFWIGGSTGSSFYPGSLEYARYSSRFRIYDGDSGEGGATISGGSSAFQTQVNLLCYNKDASGNGHGSITMTGNTFLYGSLIAWTVKMSGNPTIQKQAPELSPGDRAAYTVTDWSEQL